MVSDDAVTGAATTSGSTAAAVTTVVAASVAGATGSVVAGEGSTAAGTSVVPAAGVVVEGVVASGTVVDGAVVDTVVVDGVVVVVVDGVVVVVDGVVAAAVDDTVDVEVAEFELTAVTAANGTSHSPALSTITPPSKRADVTAALAVPPSELLNVTVLPIKEPASISWSLTADPLKVLEISSSLSTTLSCADCEIISDASIGLLGSW